MTTSEPTRWATVFVAFLAGCVGAAQIGKVAAALSLVIDDLGLTLVEGGLIVSLFTLMTAASGTVFGMLGDRFGHLRLAATGLVISAGGAFAGSYATSFGVLVSSRLVEGLGFTLAIVCLPPLISHAATARDRPLAMGLWGAFMPGGIALMMALSPWLIGAYGWRGQWSAAGWALLASAAVLVIACRRDRPAFGVQRGTLRTIGAAVLRPGPLVLFGCFACYSAMYVPLTSFFTTLLVSQKQVALDAAAWIGVPVVAGNIVGNVAAGALVRHGVSPRRLLAIAYLVMGAMACVVFLDAAPVALKAACGIVFSAFGGLVPGTLFILAPRFAAHPAQIAALSGLLLQGAGVGQTLGPLVVSASVDHFGAWDFAGLNMVVATVLGLALSSMLRRRVPRD